MFALAKEKQEEELRAKKKEEEERLMLLEQQSLKQKQREEEVERKQRLREEERKKDMGEVHELDRGREKKKPQLVNYQGEREPDNWRAREEKEEEERPLRDRAPVKEVSWLDRSSKDEDVPRDSWKERRDDDRPREKPGVWRPREVSRSGDKDGWRRGDGEISRERERDSGFSRERERDGGFSRERDGGFSREREGGYSRERGGFSRDGDTRRGPREDDRTRDRDGGDSWRAKDEERPREREVVRRGPRDDDRPREKAGDPWRPSKDEERPREREGGRGAWGGSRPRAEEREKEGGDSWRPRPAREEELPRDRDSAPKVSWRDKAGDSFDRAAKDTPKSKESGGDQGGDGWSVVKSGKR